MWDVVYDSKSKRNIFCHFFCLSWHKERFLIEQVGTTFSPKTVTLIVNVWVICVAFERNASSKDEFYAREKFSLSTVYVLLLAVASSDLLWLRSQQLSVTHHWVDSWPCCNIAVLPYCPTAKTHRKKIPAQSTLPLILRSSGQLKACRIYNRGGGEVLLLHTHPVYNWTLPAVVP